MNKKGFTLIELLAVIVILAIIALIATPAVLNIIEDSKRSAAEDSARIIAKEAETYYMSETTLQGNEVGDIDLTTDTLKYKGDKPSKGYVTYDEKGNAYLKMYMNGYCVESNYDNTVTSEKTTNEECTLLNETSLWPLKDGQVVYFNPITNSFCNTYNLSTNSKNGFIGTTDNGCMLWHAFLDTEEAETVKLILDHNSSANTMNWSNAKTEIANVKDNNLYGWHADVYPTARLISALEVNQIAPTASEIWTPAGDDYYFHTGNYSMFYGSPGSNKYDWLFDNIRSCEKYGCNIEQDNHWGYWTSTAHSIYSSEAWTVSLSGEMEDDSISYENYNGVRPVIEVPKSKFKDEEWKPLTYTITFKNGEEVVATKELSYKDNYAPFPSITKDGYKIIWKLNGNVLLQDSGVRIHGEHVLEADWIELTYLEKLYFNPITNSVCEESDYIASTNSQTRFIGTVDNGCMLWYAYKEENGSYLMILDHNTSDYHETWDDIQAEITNVKDNNLYGWHADVRNTVRMISAEEINEIAPYKGTGTWTPTGTKEYYLHSGTSSNTAGGRGTNKYAWLIDNLVSCEEYGGCDIESGTQISYWTSTVYVEESSGDDWGGGLAPDIGFDDELGDDLGGEIVERTKAWAVLYNGELSRETSTCGLRPVISVPTSKFRN